jgi:hypothetical protein
MGVLAAQGAQNDVAVQGAFRSLVSGGSVACNIVGSFVDKDLERPLEVREDGASKADDAATRNLAHGVLAQGARVGEVDDLHAVVERR